MQFPGALRRLLQAMVLAASCATGTSFAQVNLNISLAPPAPQYEVVPVVAPGYAWAPGYWTWHGENRGGYYYRHAGRWDRDPGYRVGKWKGDRHFDRGHGEGHSKGHGKGHGKHG